MRKILSIFTALLFAGAVCAQTDFAAPGYNCAADDAVLTGGSSSNFYLDVNAEPHHIAWSDVSLSSNALATWTVEASRGCYVSVSLDLGPVIASNKHNFEVKILDANQNIRGTLSEGGENTASEQVKTLEGTILLPVAGVYTVELRNNRDWGKGAIKNVILTYSADAPSEIVAVSSVELNKTEVTLEAEEVELLVATVSPENATDPTVTWATSDPEVATVSENGFVTAVAAGTANITASAGEQSATCAVTVIAPVVPNVDFAEPYVLSGKKAHLEGAIWKNEDYKLYGDGGHNKNYGTASWDIHVTKACQVKGALNGVEGGHEFVLDLYNGETLVASLTQPEGKTWAADEIALDGMLAFADAGDYTLKLRNTQEWSSGKVAGVTLTAVLENGFYLAGTMNGWGAAEGYKFVGNPANPAEFMLETTLAVADEFKVINYLNGEITAWYPGGDNYVVDAAHAGDVTIYFQPDYKADWAEFGGYFYVAVPETPIVDEWAEIKFAEAAAADDIAEEASYTVLGTEFALTLHDSGNKMAIDANDCRFGTAEAYTMYNFRIKSGGASGSDKNYFTLNIPEAGTLRIAPRTGSNGATDRALIVIQGGETLYNQIVQESQAIEVQEGENTVKVYPYVDVTVAAGEVVVRYTAGMNFYAFAFKAAGGDEPQPQECDWDAIDFLGDGSTEQTHSNQFKVCKVGEQPSVVNIQTPGFAAETGIYVTFPSAVFGEISLAEGQYVIEGAGMVLYLSAFTQEYTEVTVNWDGNDIVFTVYNAAAAPQPVEHTYTVAGGNADLFGTAWDPANTANDMTKLEDGTYKWEKTEITLPAGNVEFKVVEDHAWTVCYPAENYQLVIPEAGVYTITITYNPEGNVVAGDAVKTGDAQVDPVVSIAGSMNSWNASADVMVLAEDKATASLTLNLAAQTYEFKVVINGGDWRSNAHEFTRENATAAEMTGNLDNMHLVADVAGDYIFTWTFETNTLSIAFPIGDGIDNTAVENKAIKRIVNGQLFIEMNGVLYNAQGTIVR